MPSIHSIEDRVMRTVSRLLVLMLALGISSKASLCLTAALPPEPKPTDPMSVVHSQPSFQFANDQVLLSITELGGAVGR